MSIREELVDIVYERLSRKGYEEIDMDSISEPASKEYLRRQMERKYEAGHYRIPDLAMFKGDEIVMVKIHIPKRLVEQLKDIVCIAERTILVMPLDLRKIEVWGVGGGYLTREGYRKDKDAEKDDETMKATLEMQLECPKCGEEKTMRTEIELPGENNNRIKGRSIL